jgi:hypothetical protein
VSARLECVIESSQERGRATMSRRRAPAANQRSSGRTLLPPVNVWENRPQPASRRGGNCVLSEKTEPQSKYGNLDRFLFERVASPNHLRLSTIVASYDELVDRVIARMRARVTIV